MNSKIEQSKAAGAPATLVKLRAGDRCWSRRASSRSTGSTASGRRRCACSRVLAGLVAAALVVFLHRRKGGQYCANSCPKSRFELRKVVWPTRQETLQTTWVVIVVVIVLSLMLAFFDVVIQTAVKWLLAR